MTNREIHHEYLRFSHGLVAKKFHTMVIVNGFLFAAFNLLTLQGEKSSYDFERVTLSGIGFLFSGFWTLNIGRSLKYTEYFEKKTEGRIIVKEEFKKMEEFKWVGRMPSGNIVLIGAIGQAFLWFVLIIYVRVGELIASYLFWIGLLLFAIWFIIDYFEIRKKS